MKKQKLNVRLLRKIQKHILEEPRRLEMGAWGYRIGSFSARHYGPPCGTVGCIAGWALWLNGIDPTGADVSAKSAELLGLPPSGRLGEVTQEQHVLFYTDHWPTKYRHQFNKAKTPVGRARATARRIDYFIKHRE